MAEAQKLHLSWSLSYSDSCILSPVYLDARPGCSSRRWSRLIDHEPARIGSVIVNVLPSAGLLSTSIVPACFSIIPHAIDSPSPRPSPTSRVVKNGSKILC